MNIVNDKPTPETDAAWDKYISHPYTYGAGDLRILAQRIERERDKALEKIKQQKLEIVRLNGATNHAGGTPLKIALRERDEARDALEYIAHAGLSARHIEDYAKEFLARIK
jgi:hypothetical protein